MFLNAYKNIDSNKLAVSFGLTSAGVMTGAALGSVFPAMLPLSILGTGVITGIFDSVAVGLIILTSPLALYKTPLQKTISIAVFFIALIAAAFAVPLFGLNVTGLEVLTLTLVTLCPTLLISLFTVDFFKKII